MKLGSRLYSGQSNSEGGDSGEDGEEGSVTEVDVGESLEPGVGGESFGLQQAIASVSVPETFPEVPVIAVARNPIFPRFVKMLEVHTHTHTHTHTLSVVWTPSPCAADHGPGTDGANQTQDQAGPALRRCLSQEGRRE